MSEAVDMDSEELDGTQEQEIVSLGARLTDVFQEYKVN